MATKAKTTYQRTKYRGIRKRLNTDGSDNYAIEVRLKGHPPAYETRETLSAAVTRRERMKDEIRAGTYGRGAEATLGSLVDEYKKSEEWAELEPTTRRGYANHLKWWCKQLPDRVSLRNLDTRKVKEHSGKLRRGAGPKGRPVSESTRNRYLATLSTVLSWGVREGYLDDNPALGRKVKRRTESERGHVLTDAEWSRLDAALVGHNRLRLLVLCALSSSSRQGELLRWKWSAIRWADGVATVTTEDRKAKRNGRPRVRRARVTGVTLEALERARGDRNVVSDLVFAEPEGSSRFPRHEWNRVRRTAGLNALRFHDLRHTSISWMAASGATEAELMEHSGHRSPQMVARYTELEDAAIESAIKAQFVTRILKVA